MSGMFDRISFNEANPMMQGVAQAQALQQSGLQNIMSQLMNQNQKVANQYQPQQLAQGLRGQIGANDLQDVKLQYAPQNEQANLQHILSQSGLFNAQASKANAEAKFTPMQNIIEAMKSQQQSSRFGQAYQLSQQLKVMPTEMRTAWIAQNTPAYNEMMSVLANKSLQQQGGQGAEILNQMMTNLFPNQNNGSAPGMARQPAPPPQNMPQMHPMQQGMQAPQGMPGQIPNQMNGHAFDQLKNNPEILQKVLSSQLGSGQQAPNSPQGVAPSVAQTMAQPGQIPPQQALPNNPAMFAMPTQAQNDLMKRVAELSTNKHLTTASSQRQIEAVTQIDSMLGDPGFRERAKNASLYAGALGKGAAFVDALSQQNPKAYMDYLTFMHNDVTWLSNRIKSADNMAGTDAQREELHNAFSKAIDPATSNPQMFMSQIDNLQKSLKTLSKGVYKSTTPVFDVSRDRSQSNQGDMGADPLGIR